MVGVLPETTGGMMFEASIGGKKENCDFAIGPSRCQPNCDARNLIVFETAFIVLGTESRSQLRRFCQGRAFGQPVQAEVIALSPDS